MSNLERYFILVSKLRDPKHERLVLVQMAAIEDVYAEMSDNEKAYIEAHGGLAWPDLGKRVVRGSRVKKQVQHAVADTLEGLGIGEIMMTLDLESEEYVVALQAFTEIIEGLRSQANESETV